MLVFDSFLDRFQMIFLLGLGAIFRVVGIKRSPTSSQISMRKLALKVASEECRGELILSELGARRGVRGEVNPPPGVRRFGQSFRRMEDRMK